MVTGQYEQLTPSVRIDPGPPPSTARHLLGSLVELGNPHGEQLDLLVDEVDWLKVPAGQRLFTMGEPGDGMYALFEGRVRFLIENETGGYVTWELDAVGVFGEGALLTGEGRSRTAVVVRDALLARLPPARFDELAASAPGVALAVAKRVARRTVFQTQPSQERLSRHITLIAPSLPSARLEGIVEAIVAADQPRRRPTVIRGDDLDEPALTSLLASGAGNHAESAGPVRSAHLKSHDVLVVLGGEHHHLAETALRQSDQVYVVVDPRYFEDLRPIADFVRTGIDPLAAPTVELVLLHPSGTGDAIGTSKWLSAGHFQSHHHVRDGDGTDLRRLARHVGGRAVGLVLGGGGAKGLAHLGVIRAMNELGIPIDAVGGSSMGAIVGAQCAFGRSWQQIYEQAEQRWGSWRLRLDLTVPTVSVFSGRRSRRIFEETFGTSDLEDSWLPFFCTTVDLSTFSLTIHQRGPTAQWVRASASAPGMWPPVVDDIGHLHIDGGQLNNVPTDVMRQHHTGPIIAVDVFAKQSAMVLSPGAEPAVGMRHFWRRRTREHFPGLADTISRVALLGSLQHQVAARDYAEVYLTPDLSGVGFSSFDRIEQAVSIGYQQAIEALRPLAGELGD